MHHIYDCKKCLSIIQYSYRTVLWIICSTHRLHNVFAYFRRSMMYCRSVHALLVTNKYGELSSRWYPISEQLLIVIKLKLTYRSQHPRGLHKLFTASREEGVLCSVIPVLRRGEEGLSTSVISHYATGKNNRKFTYFNFLRILAVVLFSFYVICSLAFMEYH